mmetsp:Transcript_13579/g.23115  ORF Transcript_13579/g.23115 Transcript_13579/m.23115 type:complete len:356 (-) Transcript_13579:44-1111(-)
MRKLQREGEGVIVATALLLERVLVVADVFAVAVPANTAAGLGLLLGVDEGLHALVVGALGLDEVDEVELVLGVLARIGDPEVVPLRVGRRVVVVLEDEVVLVLPDLHRPPQVPRLEPALEHQRRVVLPLLLEVGLQLRVVPVELRRLLTHQPRLALAGPVGVVLAAVDGIVLLGQLDQVVLVDVGPVLLLVAVAGVVDAVVDDLLVGAVERPFCLHALVLLAQLRIELADGLEVPAELFEARPVLEEGLLDAGSGQLDGLHLDGGDGARLVPVLPLLVVEKVFEVLLAGRLRILSSRRGVHDPTRLARQPAVVLHRLQLLGVQLGLELALGLVLALTPQLVVGGGALRHYLDLAV